MSLECLVCFVLGAIFGLSLGCLWPAWAVRRGLLFHATDLTDAALLGKQIMIRGELYLVIPLKQGGGS